MTGKMKLVRRCELTASCGRETITSRPSHDTHRFKQRSHPGSRVSADAGAEQAVSALPELPPTRGRAHGLGPEAARPQPSLPAAPCPWSGVGTLGSPSLRDTARACRGAAPSAMRFHLPGSLRRAVQAWGALGPWVGRDRRTPAIRQWDPGGWVRVHRAWAGASVPP